MLPSLSVCKYHTGQDANTIPERKPGVRRVVGWLISRESRHGGCDPTCSVGGASYSPTLLPSSQDPLFFFCSSSFSSCGAPPPSSFSYSSTTPFSLLLLPHIHHLPLFLLPQVPIHPQFSERRMEDNGAGAGSTPWKLSPGQK